MLHLGRLLKMSKYNLSRVGFIFALFWCWYSDSLIWGIAASIIFIGLLTAGAFFIRWNFYHISINHVPNASEIFFTFDDGPHLQITPLILDTLQQHQCKATFFCIGNKIKGNEHLLQRMVSEGHAVGVHTWSHSYWFDLFPTYKMKQEIVDTQLEIQRATGLFPMLFRPPYGVTNPMLARAMKYTGVTSVGWTIRSLDTVIKSSLKIVAKITHQLRPQTIVLMHDTQARAAVVLEGLIKACTEKNLPIGDVQKYLNCYRNH